jgi:hypothetical protein
MSNTLRSFGVALLGILLNCGTRAEDGGGVSGSARDSFVEPPVWSSHGGSLAAP